MFYQKSSQDILKECESSLEGLYDFQVKNIVQSIEKVSLFQMIPIYIFSLLSFFLIQVKKCFL